MFKVELQVHLGADISRVLLLLLKLLLLSLWMDDSDVAALEHGLVGDQVILMLRISDINGKFIDATAGGRLVQAQSIVGEDTRPRRVLLAVRPIDFVLTGPLLFLSV